MGGSGRRLRRSARIGTALLLAGVAVVTVAAGSAPSKPAPRIVSASMRDADGDFRADALQLTYSQAIRHPADRDGVYPFSVAGYRVRSVGAAKGRVLVLALVERSAPDPTARPAVRYRPTSSKPVTSLSGRQAAAQTFRATRPHGHAPAPLAPPPPAASTSTAAATTTTVAASLDSDGDGTPDAQDCAPLDPTIHPGAADPPDLAFVDSDCDGIDGQEAKAVFVSPFGSDTNPGTKAKPKRTITAAVLAARGTGRYVLAAAGSYAGAVLATGVSVFGGYDAKTWHRSNDTPSIITGTPQAILADGATGVTLQLLTLIGGPGNGDSSAYGLRAIDGASLTLQTVNITAAPGAAGLAGTDGSTGANGGDGARGWPGTQDGPNGCVSVLDTGGLRGKGGAGAASAVGRAGGSGGNGGPEGGNDGQAGASGQFGIPGGRGGSGGNPGSSGLDGTSAVAPGAAGIVGDGGANTVTLAGIS
jgi:Protein of unknown function (DUF1565)